jgi:hypothetical protein
MGTNKKLLAEHGEATMIWPVYWEKGEYLVDWKMNLII